MDDKQVEGLTDDGMPSLFRAADRAAVRGQRAHVRITTAQLAMLFVAVLAGVGTQITGMSVLGFVGVAAYIVLVAVRVYGRISHQEQLWYENRQLAESMRSLTWRYAVAGAPFGHHEDSDADQDYISMVSTILGDMKYAPVPDLSQGVSLVTDAMVRLRSLPLDDRREAYATHRVMNQLRWYAARAKSDGARNAKLDAWFLTASAAAVFFGLLQAFDKISINLLGLFAIIAASVYTWQSQKRYGKQAASYANAANHLTVVHTRMGVPQSEEEWSQFVADAEEGIGREHTSWRVARSQN